MSPRPPPKISIRHDWAGGEVPLGSTELINNQKEKLFDSHKKKLPDGQNSSNQPNQFRSQFCDRSGQLDITENVIGVQTCPSEENKNVGVE